MRHSQRPLSYAVSTVLGLAAPALAALLLTSTTPSLAAGVPVQAAAAEPQTVLAPPTATPARPAVAPTRKPVVKVVAPRPVRSTTVAQPVARRTVAAAPQPTRTTAKATPKASATPTTTVSQTAQPWGTDDYPYRTAVGNPTDPWGFTERQCVSFAAWRLAQHGRAINNSDNWGSALTWDDTARRLGDTVTSTPRVGAIAQWNAGESSPYYSPGSATPNGQFVAGGYGHVAWVSMVYSDGSVLVEQYNLGDSRSYSVMRVKAPRYLLIG